MRVLGCVGGIHLLEAEGTAKGEELIYLCVC